MIDEWKFHKNEDGAEYWYNTVTHDVSLKEPSPESYRITVDRTEWNQLQVQAHSLNKQLKAKDELLAEMAEALYIVYCGKDGSLQVMREALAKYKQTKGNL
jgi:uncharacterized phage-like protein YoqJ